MATAPQSGTSPQPVFIVGPTACGKSSFALALAERLGGEIISVDSMQVYRGLDIGTAKPTDEERARVPHHLLDVVNLTAPFDAARFVELARIAETAIVNRGRVPIFCGGTGLYFKAYLYGLGEAPPSDPVLRAELENTPADALLSELKAGDPTGFERIDRKNVRRVVRAVEVLRLTGKPFSEQRADWSAAEAHSLLGLARSSADLRVRIDARVDEMFARGLVAETEALLRQGLEQNKTAMQAIGYRQVVEHLQGMRSLGETIELVKSKTRQFAKRQGTWFRRQLPVRWLSLDSNAEISPGHAENLWRRWQADDA